MKVTSELLNYCRRGGGGATRLHGGRGDAEVRPRARRGSPGLIAVRQELGRVPALRLPFDYKAFSEPGNVTVAVRSRGSRSKR